LIQISLAIDKLGTAGENIQPLFVSLDPERDTPSVLARYVSAFHPRLIGLTGTREQVRAVADAYKAYYAQYVPSAGAVDVIDHTGFIYLVDRDGQYIGFFPPGTSADRLLDIIRPHLARH
jgi:cytochrome oxidase Cu insertion factor (SCO1/SenC/PrrC family)